MNNSILWIVETIESVDSSFIIIALVALVLIQGILLWVYFTRKRTLAQQKDEIPNYEAIRKILVKQLQNLGVRKPVLNIFSARFALEGYREGNARKIQSSGIRELQYHILETIRDRGAQLKVRTAAYVFIEYIEKVLDTLAAEREQLVRSRSELESVRTSWNTRRAAVDEIVEVGMTRIRNFFIDRIPNAESFAEREAVSLTPGNKVAKEFSSIVVKKTEIQSLAQQVAGQVNETLMALGEWFWEKTGVTPAVPVIPGGYEEKALKQLAAIAAERAPGVDDGTPAVVRGLLEVQDVLGQTLRQSANENIEKTAGDVRKYFDGSSARIENRMERIDAAVKTFQSLRNEFHAHE